jgi:hypothetical protein
MNLRIGIKNYRCFSDEHPAKFDFRSGIHALVGPNNAGKSSLLKLFYDFRNLFSQLRDVNNLIPGRQINFAYPQPIGDVNELFFDGNARSLEISIDVDYSKEEISTLFPAIKRLLITISRGTNIAVVNTQTTEGIIDGTLEISDGHLYKRSDQSRAHMLNPKSLQELSDMLSSTMYIGPFRNALNVGSTDRYFDIQAGQAFITTWKNFKSGHSKAFSEASRRLEKQLAKIF